MMATEHHVITIPGFAERPDAKGLYTAIEAEYYVTHEFHKLDVYDDMPNGDRVAESLACLVKKVQDEMDKIPSRDEIYIIVKSGNNRVAASMDDDHVKRVETFVSFVPPEDGGRNSVKKEMQKWPGFVELPDGSLAVARKRGGFFIAKNQYLNDIDTQDLMAEYNRLACLSRLVIIRAMNDEIRPPISVGKIKDAKGIDILGADHHFVTGNSMQNVIAAMADENVLFRERMDD